MSEFIEAALFDLDGVIVFTDKYHYLGWKRLADEQGWAFDETVNNDCRGIPRLASLQVILNHNDVEIPEDQKQDLASRKNDYYRELLKTISREDIYPDAIEFVQHLRKHGLRTALCSSSRNAVTVLDALEIADLFDAVVTGNDIENPKPHPEIFLQAAEKLSVPSGRCLVFEDAESGVQAARNANMQCIGVGPRERLSCADACMTDYRAMMICDKLYATPVT